MDIKKLLPITIFIAIIFIAIAFNQNDDSPSISDETTLNIFITCQCRQCSTHPMEQ